MADAPGEKNRSMKQRIGGWLYRTISQRGWPRRVLALVALVIILLAGFILRTGSGYREDPSSLVPRRVSLYVEAKQLGTFLNSMGTWRLWTKERLNDNVENWSSLQQDINDILIGKITGLSTRPRKWLSSSNRAAFCIGSQEDGTTESWALYFNVTTPSEILDDIAAEPGVTMEKLDGARENSVHQMTDREGRRLFLGAVGQWLIISSDEWLPMYAFDSSRRPSSSLVSSGMLPEWSSKAAIRGLYDPERKALSFSVAGFSQFTNWLAPDVRVCFTAKMLKNGGMESTFNTVEFNEKDSVGGMWPILAVILVILAILGICIILAILLTMIGLGGWIKAAAIRAGVAPAKKPVPVEPSPAFKEDVGLPPEPEKTPEHGSITPASHDAISVSPSVSIPEENTPIPPETQPVIDGDVPHDQSHTEKVADGSTSFESGIESPSSGQSSENGDLGDSDTNESKF